MIESTKAKDAVSFQMDTARPTNDSVHLVGRGVVEVHDKFGNLRQSVPFQNLITQVGDQVYAELGSGAGTPDTPTGMRLGTGATAAAKTGAGAAIVTYVDSSSLGFDATFPQSALNGSAREITYKRTYAAGEGTSSGIVEAVITNETAITNVQGSAANTLSRATFTAVNKGAGDTLTITWTHSFEAA